MAKMDELMKRVEAMEKGRDKLKKRVGHELDELFDRFEEGLTAVGRTVRKQEKKLEKQDRRMRTLQEDLSRVRGFSPSSVITGSWRFVKSNIAGFGTWLSTFMPSSPSTLPRRRMYANKESKYVGIGLYTPPHSRVVSSSSAKPDNAGDELSPTPGSDIVEPPTPQHPSRTPSTGMEVLGEQEIIQGGFVSLALRKFSKLISDAIFGMGHIATTPLRAVLRMVFPQD